MNVVRSLSSMAVVIAVAVAVFCASAGLLPTDGFRAWRRILLATPIILTMPHGSLLTAASVEA